MREKKIKLGIIGAGNIAQEYLRVIKSQKKVQCSAIYSRTPSKIKPFFKKYEIKKINYSLKELVTDTKLDGIIIAIDAESILKVLKEIPKIKIPILIEKPIGINFYESIKIKKILNKKKLRIYAALNRRFYSSTLGAKKLINKRGNRFIKINDQQNQKNNTNKVNANLMYANSVHLIDYISMFSRGKIIKIKKIQKYKKNKFHQVEAKIYFSSKDQVFYTCNWNSPGAWSVDITQKNQRYELKPLEDLTYETLEKYKIVRKRFLRGNIDIKYKPGFYLMLRNFVKLIKRKTNSTVNFDEYLKTVKIIKKIYE